MAVYEGFPKEPGAWNVHAKIPATRTTLPSKLSTITTMIPQGTKKPDYSIEKIEHDKGDGFFINGNDIVSFFNLYQDGSSQITNTVGYIIFDNTDGYKDVFDMRVVKVLDEEGPDRYGLSPLITGYFDYQGSAKVHLVSAVSGDVSLHSVDFNIDGKFHHEEL